MSFGSTVYSLVVLFCCFWTVDSASKPNSLTFEVPNREKFCFYEEINETEHYYYSFHVLSGGSLDINAFISRNTEIQYRGTNTKVDMVYKKTKGRKDQMRIELKEGTYMFCFGNEFSAVSHKIVNFMLVSEKHGQRLHMETNQNKNPIFDGPTTLLESSMTEMFAHLRKIFIEQRSYKNRNAQGYYLADTINKRIMWWSASELALVLTVALTQVFILRRFFNDKKYNYKSVKSDDTPVYVQDVPMVRKTVNID